MLAFHLSDVLLLFYSNGHKAYDSTTQCHGDYNACNEVTHTLFV